MPPSAPLILAPIYECAHAVQVSGVVPGAEIELSQAGLVVGGIGSAAARSVPVPITRAILPGSDVTARQRTDSWSDSSQPVRALPLSQLQAPRILGPVGLGDMEVWLSRVTPGSRVTVSWQGVSIGSATAAEPLVRVNVWPVTGPIWATAQLCQQSATGAAEAPIDDPGTLGTFSAVGERGVEYADYAVPATSDGAALTTPVSGWLYYPRAGGGLAPTSTGFPLVVIAHGHAHGLGADKSYLGYHYLGQHLARWGMVACSVDLSTIDEKPGSLGGPTYQEARALVIVRAIHELLADKFLAGRIDRDRIGLVGHSMGGEAVVIAAMLGRLPPYRIRGVASIAPTDHRKAALSGATYLQILGSLDLLMSDPFDHGKSLGSASFNGFRLYDRAAGPKTHLWIHGARHNAFNTRWVGSLNILERNVTSPPALDELTHQRIAKSLINALFQDALFDRTAYRGYLAGPSLPRDVRDRAVHIQHATATPTVVDGFDDDRPTGRYDEIGRLDSAQGDGAAGIVDLGTLFPAANSPHATRALRVTWKRAGFQAATSLARRVRSAHPRKSPRGKRKR